jgi:phage baseplate assembly protein W
MADISHIFGSDISLGPTGDLAFVSVPAVTLQRLLRRLLTNPGAYFWNVDYGSGLPAMVGTPANLQAITAIVRSQLSKESAVSQSPAPTVSVGTDNNGTVSLSIAYADAATGQTQVLSVPLGD